MKKLAVFDIDGTLFRWQLYHELVFELGRQGSFSKSEATKLDKALTLWQAKHISWENYETIVIETIEKNICQISPRQLETAATMVVERSGHKIYNYTRRLLDDLQSSGYHTLAISGSQQQIVDKFSEKYGFDDCIGAVYEEVNGSFTGNKIRYTVGQKAAIIKSYVEEHDNLTLEGSIAIGDSDGDITMLELVEVPIAFNPSGGLLTLALKRGWRIVVERKNIGYTLESRDGSVVLAQTDRY